MYFIYLQKLLRRGRMISQCLQLTEALENRIFHASARCKHRIIPVRPTLSVPAHRFRGLSGKTLTNGARGRHPHRQE